MTATATKDLAMGPKTYQPFPLSQHMTLCQKHRVSVEMDASGWWRARAHDANGRVAFATVGRTRRHAETNCLIGLGCTPKHDGGSLYRLFNEHDEGPS